MLGTFSNWEAKQWLKRACVSTETALAIFHMNVGRLIFYESECYILTGIDSVRSYKHLTYAKATATVQFSLFIMLCNDPLNR